jgi:replicative DNA helicase
VTNAQDYLESPPDEDHLAALLLCPTAREWVGWALERVEPHDFVYPAYQWLWDAARVVHGRGERLSKRTLLTAVQEVDYFRDLSPKRGRAGHLTTAETALDRVSGEPVYVDQIPGAVDRVRNTARMRRLVQTLERIQHRVVECGSYVEALGVTEEMLGEIEEPDVPCEAVAFTDLVTRFEKTLANGGPRGEVVPTPWEALNDLLGGGLRPGTLCVVGGRPGDGKSVVGTEVARFAAENGFPALVVSLEMGADELTGRLLASGARVEYGELTRWVLSDDTTTRVGEYADTYRDMGLWVCDRPDMTIEKISGLARVMKKHHGLAVLVVDYVGLVMASSHRMSRQEQIAHITRTGKNLAKELECVVVVLAQVNRKPMETNRRPTLTDLRESGALEQDSDCVILLHHPVEVDGSPTGMVELILAKYRCGRTGTVSLRWRGHQTRIGD